jgi:hypothetical protein
MKKIAITLFSLVFAITLLAQQAPPQGINYQAMVYVPYSNQQPGVNSAGQIPANTKQVLVKFTLEEGNNGPVIYEETQNEVTDQYGLLNAVIGTGAPTSNSPGLFNQIDWSLGDPYLRVSITLVEYNSTVSSYQKLWSVPYALYADQANSADSANYATNSGHADSSDYADLAGNGITGVIDNGNGTLSFTYLDGSTYTTPVLTGLMGTPGPQGPAGQNGTNGQSAYDIWIAQGNTGTEQDFLNGLQGATGQSAYDLWLAQGNTGTQQDFLNSLQGFQGTIGLNGTDGQSAYDLWLAQGNTGTQQDFLNSLQGSQGTIGLNGTNGQSAYDLWLSQGNTGTQQDFLNSITGPQGPAGSNGTNAGVGGFTHYLGEAFNGGIIYYLYKGSDGLEHGLIVALTESTATWQTTPTLVNANRTEDGAYNTSLMTGSPAATYIASLGAGWYLPSIDELALLYYNRYSAQKGLRTGGNTLLSSSDYYWSSTEYVNDIAWTFSFNNGDANGDYKFSSGYVRAVRAF